MAESDTWKAGGWTSCGGESARAQETGSDPDGSGQPSSKPSQDRAMILNTLLASYQEVANNLAGQIVEIQWREIENDNERFVLNTLRRR